MKKWEHLNFEQRKIINSCLSKKQKLVEIADLINFDPSSISKEIKRNRKLRKKGIIKDKVCVHTTRFPHCCNGCPKRYTDCPFTQYTYDVKHAQSLADQRLVATRQGLNMTAQEFECLDTLIKDGVADNQSVYHVIHDNPEIKISVPTVYRLINEGKLTTKRMDLPYAVKYKKRKSHKQYEYKENSKIDRNKRTYLDFLAFIHENHNTFHVQMDFLGSIRSDKKSILTMTIPNLHYVMLFIVDSPNQEKVASIFNTMESVLSLDSFTKIFKCILTDRDTSFSGFTSIEMSPTYQTQRTHIFYCDSFNSSQKANVEQMNKQLRKFLPKGKSIDHLTATDVREVCNTINKSRIASLAGNTPNEAFSKIYGEEILRQLNSIII